MRNTDYTDYTHVIANFIYQALLKLLLKLLKHWKR